MTLRTILLLSPLTFALGAQPQATAHFDRVYPLKPEEGVFAYARISPDGRTLVYASEIKAPAVPGVRGAALTQTVTVVDLASQRIRFTERGIDAYWSPDGTRMIYSGPTSVSIRNHATGAIARNVAPPGLGDYYSWATRDAKDLILTINSNYYYLTGDKAVLPPSRVTSCPSVGVGERPLISKDGQRITTFVRGNVVVRSLTDCSYILDTGLQGAKADFSWDGRYIAFHVPKAKGAGYEIDVVDTRDKTVRTITNFAGSSLFPSWTKDGRLCFRYDGDDYRGFMMASNFLSLPARPLTKTPTHVPAERSWNDVFPETPAPNHQVNVVLIWGTWSAHSPIALSSLQRVRDDLAARSLDVGVLTATDPGSLQNDIDRLLTNHAIQLTRIPLAPERLSLTEAQNQIPTTLLFRDGKLIDRRLGAQSYEQLEEWVAAARNGAR